MERFHVVAPPGLILDVIPKHQFLWMRVEIDLVLNVAHVESADVVLDQRQRDDQGREPSMIVFDHA